AQRALRHGAARARRRRGRAQARDGLPRAPEGRGGPDSPVGPDPDDFRSAPERPCATRSCFACPASATGTPFRRRSVPALRPWPPREAAVAIPRRAVGTALSSRPEDSGALRSAAATRIFTVILNA